MKKGSETSSFCEPQARLELATDALRMRYSTN